MTSPHITPDLERLLLNVTPFRVIVHVARLADGSEAVTAPLASMAATCKIDAPRVRHALRELSAVECVRVTLTGQTAHVALTERVRGALVVPAWVDDAGLSPAAVRVVFHYAHHPHGKHSAWDAGAACRMPPAVMRSAEEELVAAGMLEPRGGRSFVVTPPTEAVATAQEATM